MDVGGGADCCASRSEGRERAGVSGEFDLQRKGSETRLQPEGAAGAGHGGSQGRTDRLLFPR